MISRTLVSAAALLTALTMEGGTRGAPERSLQIAYTAELRGNLLPCPCPSAPLGGLARRIGWVDSLRQSSVEPLFVVDAGALLPDADRFPRLPAGDLRAAVRLHMEAAAAVGYDALAAPPTIPHPDGGLPWLPANSARAIEKEGIRLLVAAVDERVDPAAAAEAIRALGPADLTVLLCGGDYHFASRAAGALGVDLAVVARGALFEGPVWHEGVLLLGPGRDGKRAGRIRITLDERGGFEATEVQLRQMDGSVPVAVRWRERVEQFVLSTERNEPGAFAFGE